jgi:hypothetical protein
MSDSKMIPLIILLIVAGGIVTWGFLTEWTFSGLIPIEGAKCSVDDDDKAANAKKYVYDEDGECTVIESCKTGWEPNSSNTACISSSSGDTCTGTDDKGVYKYNTSGVCTLDRCVTGYEKSGTSCTEIEEELCDSTATTYTATQTGTGDYTGSTLTFKTNCGTSDIVGDHLNLGMGGCQEAETIRGHCDRIDGCIGYKTYVSSNCSAIFLNAAPVCKNYGTNQIYIDHPNKTIDDSTGELVDGISVVYLNPACANGDTNRYETRGTDSMYPYGGDGCGDDVENHKRQCSEDTDCVGFKYGTDDLGANGCSHFLYKKST